MTGLRVVDVQVELVALPPRDRAVYAALRVRPSLTTRAVVTVTPWALWMVRA
jgi:hypothetical protein